MKKYFLTLTMIALSFSLLFSLFACKANNSQDNKGEHAHQKQRYHCPMHPTYTSDQPGNCPICGMKLVAIEKNEESDLAVNVSTNNKNLISNDRSALSLSTEKQQRIGVQVTPAIKKDLKILIRASGRVAYDPDLYNTIVEYQEALKTKEKIKDSPLPEVHERADALIRSSALRLRQMGLSQNQIGKLTHLSENPTNLLISEKGGTVWVYAQIYEYESGLVQPGQMMEVTSNAFTDKKLTGQVIAVDTILDPQTRTLRLRGEVQNFNDLLKPEMYVEVLIHVNLGKKLSVPKEAVLDSGTRRIVFVEEKPGKFNPREVQVGRKAENDYEIRSGLKEGEKVVVSANFLIDSESRLKAALEQTQQSQPHE